MWGQSSYTLAPLYLDEKYRLKLKDLRLKNCLCYNEEARRASSRKMQG